ncbi:Rieske 2Fe-2S domain-containing protein [candidate division GN15 bacterium]|nr:Rieske 2Fe-2S domain-containing protein [candidate division GN15 bacterium]
MMMSDKKVRLVAADELQDGEKRAFEVADSKIVLGRVGSDYFAVSGSCPHYGAPLEQGALAGHRLICPWHHATFDIRSGDLLEPPSRDGLCSYPVEIEDGDVYVRVPEQLPASCPPDMTDTKDSDRTCLILGAGAAGNAAAQSMRENGFTGRIVMVTRESRLPYDRPNLSKEYLQGQAEPDWIPLRDEKFYKDHGIEIMSEREATAIDTEKQTAIFKDGESIQYDQLLLATGGVPRSLDVPGSDLDGVFTLRSHDDADRIIEAADNASRAVVVGASFIAMEVAASLRERDVTVTVVAPEDTPMESVFGEQFGRAIQHRYEGEGITFKMKAGVAEFAGSDKLEKVILDSDESLDADFVVVGIGVDPATKTLDGLQLESDGSVRVDDHLRVTDNVYAAGDVATFTDWRTDRPIRIEHWRTAEQHGRLAGANMAGGDETYRGVPFFWTSLGQLQVGYVGHCPEWDDIIFDGEVKSESFIAYFVHGDAVRAAVGVGRGEELAAVDELMRRDELPSPDALRVGDVDLRRELRKQLA